MTLRKYAQIITPSGVLLAGGCDGFLFAIDTSVGNVGKEIWRYQVDSASSAEIISSPLVASDGTIVLGGSSAVHFIGERPYFVSTQVRINLFGLVLSFPPSVRCHVLQALAFLFDRLGDAIDSMLLMFIMKNSASWLMC